MTTVCLDGNEAAARVAYALSEVIAIYPITPATPMGELADAWSAAGRPNLWGTVPRVVEMQSEGGAAGALHGAVTTGALGTTFTASQGLLLMLPNLFKIAGELTPAVLHVAARSVATHALSIFGDHSDVMAVRTSGVAMLASGSPQEAHDLAAVAHAATLRARVPFVHFFDGFRTSHEMNGVALLTEDDLRALVDDEAVLAQRGRGLNPEHPVLRGSAQNPDVFFQAREAVNPFYEATPGIVAAAMDRLAERTGRRYHLVDYTGAPDAERVVVLMGSGAGAASEAVERLVAEGARVGLLTVRLYRPFPADALVAALPDTVTGVVVLDRTKEPGAAGEPLHVDVVTALAEAAAGRPLPRVIAGRYGLSSKEFTPAMVKAALDELDRPEPRPRLTVGIVDDVGHTSVTVDPDFVTESPDTVRAVFYGLGSDGTVGATKNAVRILGETAGLHAQGYFVYDSKKSGAVTVSHLRFGPEPIGSTYLIGEATFVACHQFGFTETMDVLGVAGPGATFLLNSPHPPEDVWDHLPAEVQEEILAKELSVWVIDANRLAAEVGLGARINTVMLPCFFALSGVLPHDEAIARIKEATARTYASRGEVVVARNLAAIDRAVTELAEVKVPAAVTATDRRPAVVPPEAPDFVQRVTAAMLAREGDRLPVSALPVDGTFPTGTARWEKRSLALELPIWDPEICIDCAKCAIACPHAAIRMKVFPPEAVTGAPAGFPAKDFRSRELSGHRLTIQVAPDDCTGCGVCVDICPAHDKTEVRRRALVMAPAGEHRDVERARFDFFETIPELDRRLLDPATVKGSQARIPLFEFSGACAGCGETPYLKLLTQLFGDRLVVANATGCSSIYGGNLPTTPWRAGPDGRGPAWSNSLFEDNAEFGLGMRLAFDQRASEAERLVAQHRDVVGSELAAALTAPAGRDEESLRQRRDRVGELRERLRPHLDGDRSLRRLWSLADDLVPRSVWLVGGDGWAYDIGAGGLDHVLASGEDVNVLVLDTEVYSNTGGQSSKATPRAAVAKFAASGKPTPKKDLGAVAMAYGNVYVAQVALGGSEIQTVKAMCEAEAWPGPSLVIAYSTCIAHGIDMSRSITHMGDAVRSGYWPLYRFHPGLDEHEHPFRLDSHDPAIPLASFTAAEGRYAMLQRSDPQRAEHLQVLAQADVDERWRLYRQLAGVERTVPHEPSDLGDDRGGEEEA